MNFKFKNVDYSLCVIVNSIISSMKNFTSNVLSRLDCKDDRSKIILEKIITHLHDFIRDVKPTEEEFFNNERHSRTFDEFLDIIATRVSLKNFKGYFITHTD